MGGKSSYGEWVEWVVEFLRGVGSKRSYGEWVEWVVRVLTGSGLSGW